LGVVPKIASSPMPLMGTFVIPLLPTGIMAYANPCAVGRAMSTFFWTGGRPSRRCPLSRSEGDLLVGLPLVMTAHFDLHFLVQTLQKVEQLVRGEAAEMTVHQV